MNETPSLGLAKALEGRGIVSSLLLDVEQLICREDSGLLLSSAPCHRVMTAAAKGGLSVRSNYA